MLQAGHFRKKVRGRSSRAGPGQANPSRIQTTPLFADTLYNDLALHASRSTLLGDLGLRRGGCVVRKDRNLRKVREKLSNVNEKLWKA